MAAGRSHAYNPRAPTPTPRWSRGLFYWICPIPASSCRMTFQTVLSLVALGSHAVASEIKIQRQMQGKGKAVMMSLAFNAHHPNHDGRMRPLLISEGNFGWPRGKETHKCPMGVWQENCVRQRLGLGGRKCFLGYSCWEGGAS